MAEPAGVGDGPDTEYETGWHGGQLQDFWPEELEERGCHVLRGEAVGGAGLAGEGHVSAQGGTFEPPPGLQAEMLNRSLDVEVPNFTGEVGAGDACLGIISKKVGVRDSA